MISAALVDMFGPTSLARLRQPIERPAGAQPQL
jgi:hypothetical protein